MRGNLDSTFDWNAPAAVRPPFLFTRIGGVLALVAVIAASHFWMSYLEFQLDDFEQVAEASHWGSPAVLLGQDTPKQQELRAHATMVRFFRPLLHLSLAADAQLFGVSPKAFHTSSIVWHAIVCALLFLGLRSLMAWRSKSSAFFAALVFALMPGKNGAVTWIAARGDVLAAAAFLAGAWALAQFRRKGSLAALAAVFLFQAAALASKEGAVTVPILIALIDIVLTRRFSVTPISWKRSLRVALPVAFIAPLYLVWRSWHFGVSGNFYAGENRTWTWEIIRRMASDFGPCLDHLIGGYFHDDPGSLTARLHSSCVGLITIGIIVWAARRPIKRSLSIAALLGLTIVAMLPALRFYREASGFDASRLFYLPAIPVALLIALPLSGFESSLKPLRSLTFLYAVVLATTSIVAFIQHARAQWSASQVVARVRQDLTAFARGLERKDVGFLLLDVPNDVDHAPCYGTFLSFAFRDPFIHPPIAARSIIDLGVFIGNEEAYGAGFPLQVLRWNAADMQLVPQGGVSPAPTGQCPELTLPPNTKEIELVPPLCPRDVRVLAVDFLSPLNATSMTLRFIDDHDRNIDFAVHWDSAHGTASRLLLGVSQRKDWVFSGPLKKLELLRADASMPLPSRIVTNLRLPTINVVKPAPNSRLSAAAAEPIFMFDDAPEIEYYRLTIIAGGSSPTWTVRRKDLLRVDGHAAIKISHKGCLPGESARYWSELTADGNKVNERGVREMLLPWRIEGFTGQFDWPQSSSTTTVAYIVP